MSGSQAPSRSRAPLHVGLLLLWVLAWGLFPLLVSPVEAFDSISEQLLGRTLPREVLYVGMYGAPVLLVVLVLRWIGSGFIAGYERMVGLRIIRRERIPRGTRLALYVSLAIVAVTLGLLIAGFKSLALVLIAAVATFVGLLLLLMQFTSIFGTTSIIGVVLGVAALIVVQSVATGFQHEFERRVLGVYAHINVTQPFGIVTEYRRFEGYLRDGRWCGGGQPLRRTTRWLLAPYRRDARLQRRRHSTAHSVLVKGIEPDRPRIEVIDLRRAPRAKCDPGAVDITAFDAAHVVTSSRSPCRIATHDLLPEIIANRSTTRGGSSGTYDADAEALARALPERQARTAERMSELHLDLGDDDEWPEDVELEGSGRGSTPVELPTMFVGKFRSPDELNLEVELDLVMLVDPGPSPGITPSDPRSFGTLSRWPAIFRAGFQEYDTRLVYVHIKELQYFKYRGKDQGVGGRPAPRPIPMRLPSR